LAKELDVALLARGTTGFTGADLENMVNQAALRASIDGADSVSMKYLEIARDKVLMGKLFSIHNARVWWCQRAQKIMCSDHCLSVTYHT
jgi:ATP-dependent 26S proteasome regulatory subunit